MHRLTIQYEAPADPAAFDAVYFEEHVPLCRPLPGLLGMAFSKPRPLAGGSAPYLIAQLDFADADALRTALRSPEGAAVAEHADTLPATRVTFVGEVISG